MRPDNKLTFRYDDSNIPSMVAQLKHEQEAILRHIGEWTKPFVKGRVKREFPFVQKKRVTTKRGNVWHLRIFANSEEDVSKHLGIFNYMEYNSKYGKGFIAIQVFNGHYVAFDFTPHAIMRYRQRYLTERNINVPFDEQAERMVDSLFCHDLNVDENLVILITEQGAFHGEYIGNVWMQFKTFIAYENAFRNQREVIEQTRERVKKDMEEIQSGMSINEMYARQEAPQNVRKIEKEVTKSMIRKRGMYHEHAYKREVNYENDLRARRK